MKTHMEGTRHFNRIISFLLLTAGIGVVGTLSMDIGNYLTAHMGITYEINRAFIGALARGWTNGIFVYNSPSTIVPGAGDYYFGVASHYLIGIVFAIPVFFAVYSSNSKIGLPWIYVYGLLTSVASLFVLFPAVGLGVAASKSDHQLYMVYSNLINHTFYGLGLVLAVYVARSRHANTGG